MKITLHRRETKRSSCIFYHVCVCLSVSIYSFFFFFRYEIHGNTGNTMFTADFTIYCLRKILLTLKTFHDKTKTFKNFIIIIFFFLLGQYSCNGCNFVSYDEVEFNAFCFEFVCLFFFFYFHIKKYA